MPPTREEFVFPDNYTRELNRYVYAAGNPATLVDPSGETANIESAGLLTPSTTSAPAIFATAYAAACVFFVAADALLKLGADTELVGFTTLLNGALLPSQCGVQVRTRERDETKKSCEQNSRVRVLPDYIAEGRGSGRDSFGHEIKKDLKSLFRLCTRRYNGDLYYDTATLMVQLNCMECFGIPGWLPTGYFLSEDLF